MAIVAGALNARLLPNGTVETSFTPKEGVVLRPMLAKNLDTAEQDFVNHYHLKPIDTSAFCARIRRDGTASVPVAL